ncbi:MAG: ferritin-like domain-containing protein [Planctomycetia bacterium]|nr:ferritin-like domain-containing protein [Planctomycetia bacterium]
MPTPLRTFADLILLSPSIDDKLVPPDEPLTDADPGPAERIALPARPPNLVFCGRKQSPPMPHPDTLGDPKKRAAAHHIMANHELQALEVMAFVLRAFPQAPAEFRAGLARIMADEQRHTRLHLTRLAELGMAFGDLPVNGYFWNKAQEFETLLDYVAGLPLTFEGRNLDHTLEFEEWFQAAGDEKSAGVMRAIHRDEIQHVAFGIHWLRILKPAGQSDWEAYAAALRWPLRPEKSRGKTFHRAPRLAAGLSPEFIDRLEREGN